MDHASIHFNIWCKNYIFLRFANQSVEINIKIIYKNMLTLLVIPFNWSQCLSNVSARTTMAESACFWAEDVIFASFPWEAGQGKTFIAHYLFIQKISSVGVSFFSMSCLLSLCSNTFTILVLTWRFIRFGRNGKVLVATAFRAKFDTSFSLRHIWHVCSTITWKKHCLILQQFYNFSHCSIGTCSHSFVVKYELKKLEGVNLKKSGVSELFFSRLRALEKRKIFEGDPKIRI